MFTVRHLRGSLTSPYCCQSCCFLAPSGGDRQTEAHIAQFAQESVCFVIFKQDLQQSVQILKRSEQQFCNIHTAFRCRVYFEETLILTRFWTNFFAVHGILKSRRIEITERLAVILRLMCVYRVENFL